MGTFWTAIEILLLACALGAALMVRPWRLLGPGHGDCALATPLLAAVTLLPWLWAWPLNAGMPFALQWSGSALAVLMLGWPLAVPLLVLAGLSTILTVGASWHDALFAIVWYGVLPATLVLSLGHVVRRLFGHSPAAYLLGRAFVVPLLALFACTFAATMADSQSVPDAEDLRAVVAFLMAMGETSWTCVAVATLVACKPQWLATWSDDLYFSPPHRSRSI